MRILQLYGQDGKEMGLYVTFITDNDVIDDIIHDTNYEIY